MNAQLIIRQGNPPSSRSDPRRPRSAQPTGWIPFGGIPVDRHHDSPIATLLLSILGPFAGGVYTQRKKALTALQVAEIREQVNAGETKAAHARRNGVSRETRHLREQTRKAPTQTGVPEYASRTAHR